MKRLMSFARVADHGARLLFLATLGVGLTLPGTVLAQRQIDDRRPVSSDVQVEVDEIIVGDIRVVG